MKIGYFLSHPIQYQSPLIRFLVREGVDLWVCYATDLSVGRYADTGFGRAIQWDVPLLEGYTFDVLEPNGPFPKGFSRISKYKRLISAQILEQKVDAVWVHGWGNAYSLAAIMAARRHKLPILLRGETHLQSIRSRKLLRSIHKAVLKWMFKNVDAFLAVGTLNREFYQFHGVPTQKIFHAPYSVDNSRFNLSQEMECDARRSVQMELGIKDNQKLILFCGKLIDVKSPDVLIHAIANLKSLNCKLVFIGTGDLKNRLTELAEKLGLTNICFLGFRNQTELPRYYAACDLFVLPSRFEPWGLVVNEVLNAGKPVIVSNKVGAGPDLISPGVNGDVFEAGNWLQLSNKIEQWFANPATIIDGVGMHNRLLMDKWGFREVLQGLRNAVRSLERRQRNGI